MRPVTAGYISYRGTMHDKLCRVLWFVKRVLWVCESNADSPYFWGALNTPRGSFKHKLNFNCFVQDVSETIWMWGWVVCHCYRLMRQMVAGLIAAMTPGSKGSWTEAEKECSVYLKLCVSFVADAPYVSPNKWLFLFIGQRLEQHWEIPITWINIHAIG